MSTVDPPGRSVPELPWPEGWHRPVGGGWPRALLMLFFGALCLVAGPAMVADGVGAAGYGAFAFGILCAAAVPILWPRRRGQPELGRSGSGPDATALLFPLSRARNAGAIVIGLAAAAASLAIATDPGGGRHSPAYVRVLGVLGVLLFGWLAVVGVRGRLTGPGHLALGVDGVTFAQAGRFVSLPWQHVRGVRAIDFSAGAGLNRAHTPLLGFDADDPEHVVTSGRAYGRRVRKRSRQWGADLVVAVLQLRTDPKLAYWAARYYAEHPEARGELADARSLDRLRDRRLTG